jgi:hypothetical protein
MSNHRLRRKPIRKLKSRPFTTESHTHPTFTFIDTLLSKPRRLADFKAKYPTNAVKYYTDTWLIWKENLVAAYINQRLHFGVTVTSPIEGCHATIKTFLQRGHGDLRGVFNRLKLFWAAQQETINSTVGQQQLRPKHNVNIPLFAAILPHIHAYTLQKIREELVKIPAKAPPQPVCTYSIKASITVVIKGGKPSWPTGTDSKLKMKGLMSMSLYQKMIGEKTRSMDLTTLLLQSNLFLYCLYVLAVQLKFIGGLQSPCLTVKQALKNNKLICKARCTIFQLSLKWLVIFKLCLQLQHPLRGSLVKLVI